MRNEGYTPSQTNKEYQFKTGAQLDAEMRKGIKWLFPKPYGMEELLSGKAVLTNNGIERLVKFNAVPVGDIVGDYTAIPAGTVTV